MTRNTYYCVLNDGACTPLINMRIDKRKHNEEEARDLYHKTKRKT